MHCSPFSKKTSRIYGYYSIQRHAESTRTYKVIWVCPRAPCSLYYNSKLHVLTPYSPDIESFRILTIQQQAESTLIYTLIRVHPRGPCSLRYISKQILRIFTTYSGKQNLPCFARLDYLSRSALHTVLKNKQNLSIITI